MAYSLKPGEPVAGEIRRAATEQIDRALAEIADPALDNETTVHQVRKRCKKLRALLRLVESGIGPGFRRENRWYRDTARGLGAIRDAHQLDNTLQLLADQSDVPLAPGGQAPTADQDIEASLADTAKRLRKARDRIADWPLDARGYGLVGTGFQATYASGRRRLQAAMEDTTARRLHEWRKAVKYHAYQLKLLRPAWPVPLAARYREVARLGDCLGDEHDLCVLADKLATTHEQDAEATALLLKQLARRQRKLRRKALRLGQKIYAEKPGRLGRRVRAYFRVERAAH